MKTSQNNILGILIHSRHVEVSEIERSGVSLKIRKRASYTLADGVTVENIAQDSVGFKSFLLQNGFKSKRAVIGISAKHFFSTVLEVPPIADELIKHQTIGLNLERKIEFNLSDVVFAYDEAQDSASRDTLILVAGKKTVNQIKELLKAVKVVPARILSASLMFKASGTSSVECNMVELEETVELCLYDKGQLVAVQSIAKDTSDSFDEKLAEKVVRYINRRRISLSGNSSDIACRLYSQKDPQPVAVSKLKTAFSNVTCTRLSEPSENFLNDVSVELAQRALSGKLPAINFLNGRTTQVKPSVIRKHLKKIVYSVLVVLALVFAFVFSWQMDKVEITKHQEELALIKKPAANAKDILSRISSAKRWYDVNPEYLTILLHLSEAFPQNSDIWLTGLGIDKSSEKLPDGTEKKYISQLLNGRTVSQDAVLDLTEKFKQDNYFDEVELMHIREVGRGSNVMTFAIKLKRLQE